jgi:hypothetical protein
LSGTTLTTDQATYAVGARITVTYSGLPGNQQDWIAIAPEGSAATSYVAYVFTNGQQSGTATFTAPAAGSYVARAFPNNTFALLAESAPFGVPGVSVDRTSYAPGSTITVTYAGLPGDLQDWIAIAPAGAATTSYVAYVFTNGQQSGTATFTAPAAGSYVVRAFPNNTFALLAESAPFGVTSVSTDATSYALGARITVSYAGLPGNLQDWIAIAPAGAPTTSYVAYVFTNGQKSGTATFAAPAAGSYVARAFPDNTFVLVAESPTFVVAAATAPTVATDKSSYAAGSTITVTYAGLPGNLQDWIALAPAGSANTSYVAYVFTNGQKSGAATFATPAAGSYVARALVNNTFTRAAESATFAVVAAPAPTVTTDRTDYAVGDTVTVTYTGLPGNLQDWIALAPAGSANTSYVNYVFTNGQQSGTATFPAPAAGSYVARSLVNNTFTLAAESAAFATSVSSVAFGPLPLCNSFVGCAAGSSCVVSADDGGHCVPDLPQAVDGQPCNDNIVCVAGTSCVGTSPLTTCRAPGEQDAACRPFKPFCNDGLGCGSGSTCQPVTTTGQCGLTLGCPSGATCPSSTCVPEGQLSGACRVGPNACDAGSACTGGDDYDAYVIRGTRNGSCVAALGLNSTCVPPAQCTQSSCTPCESGLYCDANTVKCSPRGVQGARCFDDATCNAGLTCADPFNCVPAAQIAADRAPCSSANLTCRLGWSCTFNGCVPHGEAFAPCNNTGSGPVCSSPNLYCSGTFGTPPLNGGAKNICDPYATTVGGICGTSTSTSICPQGTSCQTTLLDATHPGPDKCLPPGVEFGQCRALPSTACDSGLGCPSSPILGCVHLAAVGANCGSAACVQGSSCTNALVCAADGTSGAKCRFHDAAHGACDAGLGCAISAGFSILTGKCAAGLADGATCNPSGGQNPCARPDVCVTSGGTSTCRAAGYTEQVVTSASFIDACAAGQHFVHLPSNQFDPRAAIVAPFAFRFWGSDVQKLWPNINGWLSFVPLADPHTVGSGYLPSDEMGPAAAPFWDALQGSDICYATVGAAPNRQLVVEWSDAGRVGRLGVSLDFEVVLHETTNVVDLVYGALSPTTGSDAPWADGQRAAIGLQSGQNGVAIVHAGAAPAGGALRYTPK